MIVDMGSRIFQLRWSTSGKEEHVSLSHYQVITVRSDGNGTVQQTSENFLKLDNLELGYLYEFVVVAVTEVGGIVGWSKQSNPVRLAGLLSVRNTWRIH